MVYTPLLYSDTTSLIYAKTIMVNACYLLFFKTENKLGEFWRLWAILKENEFTIEVVL